ncbi:MAG: SGNH/GDSL hydrolase family protein [Gammaproteobacteria bacterium]
MSKVRVAGASLILSLVSGLVNADTSVLFIGNSFTFGWGSPVRFYRPDSVTDLNEEGVGGMPALFKSFVEQAGLDYDVYVETRPGTGLDYHLENKLDVIGRHAWDAVVMHGYSTLDPDRPRDPAKLINTSRQMAQFLRSRNAQVEIYLMATWSRADQIWQASGAWAGEPVDAMARDVRAAYDAAADAAGADAVIPVGEAWNLAMHSGVADPNPYDGIEANTVDLWTYDHYHGSAYGYYLEALVVFGMLTGRDPRELGENECSAYELGFSPGQTAALQRVAREQLVSEGALGTGLSSLPRRDRMGCIAVR